MSERVEKFLSWANSNIGDLLQKFDRENDHELRERFLIIANEILKTKRVIFERKNSSADFTPKFPKNYDPYK